MNVFSLLDLATVLSGESLGEGVTAASLIPEIDFGGLITDEAVTASKVLTVNINEPDEAVTELEVGGFNSADISVDEASEIDVSATIQDIIDFIDELPGNATIIDALSSIDILDFSDEQLLDLLAQISELVDTILPGASQLSISTIFDEGLESFEDLTDSTGAIDIDGASLSGELTLDGETRSFTANFSDEVNAALESLDESLLGITGNLSVDDGLLTGLITIDETQYELGLDVTQALTGALSSLLIMAETTLPFSNGTALVSLDTAFGEIDGTLNFAGGDLDLALSTPFGAVDTSVDFPDSARLEVPFEIAGLPPLDLVLDLSTGVLSVPLLGGISIPLETFSGELRIADSTATLRSDIGFPIETSFELDPLLGQIAVALTEDITGLLTVDAGEVDGSIVSELGEFGFFASLGDLVPQVASLIEETSGLLSLDQGTATLGLDTPFGEFSGGLALALLENTLVNEVVLLA